MIMTSSPVIPSHPHTPLHSPSPSSSPSLRPLASSMAKIKTPAMAIPPSSSNTASGGSARSSSQARSYARAPTARPYGSFSPRGGKPLKAVDGDTKQFAELVAAKVEDRSRRMRMGPARLSYDQKAQLGQVEHVEERGRQVRSLGGSLAGSYENEKAELIVDIPVWSPGSFQDLGTLHSLRETTLAHTHSLLSYLINTHSIPASYRLLARSATGSTGSYATSPSATSATSNPNRPTCDASCSSIGWGCIRLAPSAGSPIQSKRELKPAVRRSSVVIQRSHNDARNLELDDVPSFKLDLDSAIEDEDEDESERGVHLRQGYLSERSSDDESEDECADVLVAREVKRRGAKAGSAFLMTLFGHPALILL